MAAATVFIHIYSAGSYCYDYVYSLLFVSLNSILILNVIIVSSTWIILFLHKFVCVSMFCCESITYYVFVKNKQLIQFSQFSSCIHVIEMQIPSANLQRRVFSINVYSVTPIDEHTVVKVTPETTASEVIQQVSG